MKRFYFWTCPFPIHIHVDTLYQKEDRETLLNVHKSSSDPQQTQHRRYMYLRMVSMIPKGIGAALQPHTHVWEEAATSTCTSSLSGAATSTCKWTRTSKLQLIDHTPVWSTWTSELCFTCLGLDHTSGRSNITPPCTYSVTTAFIVMATSNQHNYGCNEEQWIIWHCTNTDNAVLSTFWWQSTNT